MRRIFASKKHSNSECKSKFGGKNFVSNGAELAAGGNAGCAGRKFRDSPPLAGWAQPALLWFVDFGRWRVTWVTVLEIRLFSDLCDDQRFSGRLGCDGGRRRCGGRRPGVRTERGSRRGEGGKLLSCRHAAA